MATKVRLSLQANNAVKIRSAVTAVDTAAITDANYDPTAAAQPQGYRRVAIFCRFTGASADGTATLKILHRVAQGPLPGGNGWAVGETSVALLDGGMFFVDVMGRDFFVMVTALGGTTPPTSVDIWGTGWEAYRYDGPRGA